MRTLRRLLSSAAYSLALSGALLAAPFAYISNSGSNGVSVIDTATERPVPTIAAVGGDDSATSPDVMRPIAPGRPLRKGPPLGCLSPADARGRASLPSRFPDRHVAPGAIRSRFGFAGERRSDQDGWVELPAKCRFVRCRC